MLVHNNVQIATHFFCISFRFVKNGSVGIFFFESRRRGSGKKGKGLGWKGSERAVTEQKGRSADEFPKSPKNRSVDERMIGFRQAKMETCDLRCDAEM